MKKSNTDCYLIRANALPYSALDKLEFTKTIAVQSDIVEMEAVAESLVDQLSEVLYKKIRESSCVAEQKSLLNLKRDIYNNRYKKVINNDIDKLSGAMRVPLVSWIAKKNEIDEKKLELESMFQTECSEKREIIKGICANNLLQTSILLSNYDLFQRLQIYLKHEDSKMSRKIRNTEISLLNYISRMTYKPSPFALFAGLNYGQVGEEPYIESKPKKNTNQCVINISFFKFIENKLLELDEFYQKGFISINQTLKINGETAVFITRKIEGTAGSDNIERVVELKLSEAMMLVINAFEKENVLDYQKIFQLTAERYGKDGAKLFIDKLIEAGLLQNFLIYPNQTIEYLQNLLKITSQSDNPLVQEIKKILEKFCRIQAGFSGENPLKQSVMIQEIKRGLEEIWDLFGEELKIDSNSLLFVDSHFPQSNLQIHRDIYDKLSDDVKSLSQFMRLFDDSILQEIALRIFYKENYKNQAEVDILKMYALFMKSDKGELWKKVQNDSTYNTIKRLRQKVYGFLKQHLLLDSAEITLPNEWLKKIFDDYPAELKQPKRFSYYLQMYENEKNKSFVLNKLGPGYYRHYSRYLSLFNQVDPLNEFSNYVKMQYKNMQRENETEYVDINAVLGLNINIHENILGKEISYPRSCPNPKKEQIKIAELTVRYDERWNTTYIYDRKNKKRVEVIPLGFLFPMIAPPLYNFVANYSKANGVEYSFWSKFIAENELDGQLIFPRIVYQNIVIDRKTWIIQPEEFAIGNDVKTFLENINVLEQRRIHSEVFVKVSANMDSFKEEYVTADFQAWMDEVKNTKLRKPQYINFKNQYYQQVAAKMISKTDHMIQMQEVLPDKSCAGTENAIELLVEF